MKPNSGKGMANFLKVTGAAVIRPSRILTGILVAGTAVALPAIAVPTIIGGSIAVLAMSWADINDPDFIAKVLKPNHKEVANYSQRLAKLIIKLRENLRQGTYPEVSTDIDEAVLSLEKITQMINSLPNAEQGSVSFVVDQIEKLTDRLLMLVKKEQVARRFLQETDATSINRELTALESSLKNISDAVAKKQIRKAIQQKQSQLETIDQVKQRLSRIDAYIANIRAVLYSTYSDLARLQLRDELTVVDDADVLNDTLKQIVAEIDAMDSTILEIEAETTNSKQSVKTAISN